MKRTRSRLQPGDTMLSQTRRCFLALALVIILLNWPLPNPVQAAAGDLDAAFGTGGKVITDFSGGRDDISALALQPDGKIIAAGGGASGDFALARYNPDGSLDATFGTSGKVTTEFGVARVDNALDVTIQGDGKIVLVGGTSLSNVTTVFDFALARYNADGSLDMTFGAGGLVVTDFFGFSDHAETVSIQSDGKIIATGSAATSSYSTVGDFALARYNADGSLDTTFGTGGKVITDFGNLDVASDALIQSDGKIVAVGSGGSLLHDFNMARYNPDGSLDETFGTGGRVTTDFGRGASSGHAVALQSDSKIVLAGVITNTVSSADFALVRYNPDGSVDTTFGTGGSVVTDFFGEPDTAREVVVQPSGHIVAAGYTLTNVGFDFALARYKPDGSLDTTFGNGGKVTTDFGAQDLAVAVALQLDGKIIVAGTTVPGPVSSDFALARYDGLTSNGVSFDTCLQDDANGNVLQLNSITGDYQFTKCGIGSLTVNGIARVTRRGSTVILEHNASDRRVSVKIDNSARKATASLQMLLLRTTFTLMDRNIANNNCTCQ